MSGGLYDPSGGLFSSNDTYQYTPLVITESEYSKTGIQVSSSTTVGDTLVAKARRGGKSSNRRLPIPGTSTLWIKPSTYTRGIANYVTLTPGLRVYMRLDGSRQEKQYSAFQFPKAELVENTAVLNRGGTKTDSGVEDLNMVNRANVEALLKLKDGKANWGENLATAAQTAGLFQHLAHDFVNLIVNAKRFRWAKIPGILNMSYVDLVRRGSKRAAEDYLRYIYGLAPLMGDIRGTRELLEEQLKPAMIISGYKSVKDNPIQESFGRDPSVGDDYLYTYNRRRSTTVHLYGRIQNAALRDASRLGLTDPLSLAWELTPWSFFVDWSLPIGNFLAALTATQGVDWVGGYRSTKIDGTTVMRVDPKTPYPGSKYWTVPGVGVRFESVLRRTALSGFPTPLPYVKSPFSNSHGVTALALLRTNLRALFR